MGGGSLMLARTSVFAFLFSALGVVVSAQRYGVYRPYLEVRFSSSFLQAELIDGKFKRQYDWTVSDSNAHEAAVTGFVTAEFALEWSVETSSHGTKLIPPGFPRATIDLGAFDVRSENFILQLHYPTENRIKPYLGLGANRMRISNMQHLRGPTIHYYDFAGAGNRYGLVAQLGVDFLMRWNLILNVDVKHAWNKAVLKQVYLDNPGLVRYYDFMSNPTYIGLGVGLRW
jgi:outer membrane protein W